MQGSRRAARTDEIIKRIEAVLNKGTAAVAAKRFDQLFDLNQRFHGELAAAGQNTVLGDLLQRLRERTAMLFAPMDPGRQARSWEEHAAILRAIIEGDERTAATLAAEHVMRAGMDFLVGLNAGGDGPLLVLPERRRTPDGAARKTSVPRAQARKRATTKARPGKPAKR